MKCHTVLISDSSQILMKYVTWFYLLYYLLEQILYFFLSEYRTHLPPSNFPRIPQSNTI